MKKFLLIVGLCLMWGCSQESAEEEQKEQVPAAAVLITPVNDNVCEEGTVISDVQSEIGFQWKAGEHADLFELEVVNLMTTEVFNKKVETTGTTLKLERGMPYAWKVISMNAENPENKITSESWKFYLPTKGESSYAPFPAELVAPTFDAVVSPASGKIILEWKGSDPDSNSLNYTIYFDTDQEKVKSRSSAAMEATGTSKEVEVESGKTYYWLVETSDGKNSSYSQVFQFTTE